MRGHPFADLFVLSPEQGDGMRGRGLLDGGLLQGRLKEQHVHVAELLDLVHRHALFEQTLLELGDLCGTYVADLALEALLGFFYR